MQTSGDKDSITIRFDTESEKNQVLIVMEALDIFSRKNAKYNDAWGKYGSYGAAFFALDRAERIWQAANTRGDHKFNTEDALDLINLCCFAIRSQRLSNIGGTRWPQMNEAKVNEIAVCERCGSEVWPCPEHPGATAISKSNWRGRSPHAPIPVHE